MESDPRLLVTGASGQLGRALRNIAPGGGYPSRDLDLHDVDAVAMALGGVDVVVHCAAMTNVDACEADPDSAFRINAGATEVLVHAAEAAGARIVYISTDYVFDGKEGDYSEHDTPNPINIYGASKLQGERHVAQASDSIIVRTSWLIGEGHNFARTIAARARATGTVRVVDDQWGRPTVAADLARALIEVAKADLEGVIHLTGTGPLTTWAEFARYIIQTAGIEATIEAISTEEYVRSANGPIAPRPRRTGLASAYAADMGLTLPNWRTSVAEHIELLT